MKVICLGDSITYGQGVSAKRAWPGVLAESSGWDVRNEGVCGDTSRLGLERFAKAVQIHRPDVVVIQYGHNDANVWESDDWPRVSSQAFEANIHELRARVLALRARPLVLAPHDPVGRDDDYQRRIAWLRAVLKTVAVGPPVSHVLNDGYGVHPEPGMHREYATLVEGAICRMP